MNLQLPSVAISLGDDCDRGLFGNSHRTALWRGAAVASGLFEHLWLVEYRFTDSGRFGGVFCIGPWDIGFCSTGICRNGPAGQGASRLPRVERRLGEDRIGRDQSSAERTLRIGQK